MRASVNVPRTLVYQVLDGAAFSVWQQTVLPKFVYTLMGNSNAYVGYVATCMGVAQVLAGVGGSVISDRTGRRELLLRAAAAAGIVGAALLCIGAFEKSIHVIFAGMFAIGVYAGASNPNAEALFGDSVSSAHRPTVYTYKWMLQIIAFIVGYALTIALFLSVGNTWSYTEMQYVIAAGLGLHLCAFGAMLGLRDNAKLPTTDNDGEADDDTRASQASGYGTMAPDGDSNSDYLVRGDGAMNDSQVLRGSSNAQGEGNALPVSSPVSGMEVPFHSREAHATPSGSPTRVHHRAKIARDKARLPPREAARLKAATEAAYFDDEGNAAKQRCVLFTRRGIPYWVVAGDFLSSVAAGMTVRYFPLFFIHAYGVEPIGLTILFTISTVVVTAWAALIKVIASKVTKNRLTAAIAFRFCGSLCTFYMAFAPGAAANFYPMAVMFVLRMAFMNATFGLTRSVIMDHVPSAQRAKWSAVESVTSFTWAGSALVGGIIADHHGYRATFSVTATIGAVASMIAVPGACMIRDAVFTEDPEPESNTSGRAHRASSVGPNPTHQPPGIAAPMSAAPFVRNTSFARSATGEGPNPPNSVRRLSAEVTESPTQAP